MDEPIEVEKEHKLNCLILLLVAFFITFPTMPLLLYKYAIQNPNLIGEQRDFVITPGSNVKTIAKELKDQNFIEQEYLFELYVRLNNLEQNLQAGYYKIPPKQSIEELAALFQKGYDDVQVTFLEGWRLEEFALHAVKIFPNVDFFTFLELTKDGEGTLFPDTYTLNKNISTEELVSKLKSNFEKKTTKIFANYPPDEAGLTTSEAYILASIVEREINKPEDRPAVAGILIKRYKEGEPLGADATTQYAVGKSDNFWPKELTIEDLNSDSPYNTRKNIGLPPTPIASFSENALISVLTHKDTDYYYYLSDKNGVTRFAKNYEEHLKNIEKYLNNR